MLQKYLAKKILAFSVCTLMLNSLFAQKETAAERNYHAFITTENKSNNNNKQFLIIATAASINPFVQNQQLLVLRQLNDSVYIVQLNDKTILPSFKQSFSANNNWKLSPSLANKILNDWPLSLLITVNNATVFIDKATEKKIIFTSPTVKNAFVISIKDQTAFNTLLQDEQVNFISEYNRHPKEELQINNLDVSVNKINVLQSKMPALNGNGVVVSIKENKPDTTDIDLAGRYITNSLAATATNSHATIMATMAAGAGNSYYLGRGVAPGATITSSNFSNLFPDADQNYTQNNISVQNHSYGVGVENFYGADAAAFDASSLANDKLLFVFSSGNSGTATPATGNYAGITGVANLTGSFKMAKNIITVGAVDSFNTVVGPSSKGPAYDGRIKPEMVAYGEDGSSGSAALVSGTALVLQQAYKNNNAGNLPSSALVKAVLLNSCDDVYSDGIDFTSGFGSLNALKAAEGMVAQRYFTGTVSNSGTQTFAVTIPPNISKAKFTLVWNDAPASANAFKAIKNDLDLQLKSIASSQVWLPWVLNSFPNKDSLQLLPVRKRDSLNTIEQVTLDNPAAGNYTLTVNGFSVGSATQPFAIAYQFDTVNVFSWVFPTANDNIFPASANLVRWTTSFGSTTASLEYSINNGASWQAISSSVGLNTKYLQWTAPDTNAIGLLRMTIGGQQFISDPFTISAKPNLNIGFNCADSVLLYWNKNKGITNYQLYGLGTKYLQPLSVISDTQFIFNKNILSYLNFAVAPIINNRTGVKSYATNYSAQGVECYIKNLLADLVNNNADIKLDIGTTYLIKKIVVEKLTAGSFAGIYETTSINSLSYFTTDTHLQKGVNTYRVAIYLLNGKIVYSDAVSVIYFGSADVLIYPNPVLQNNSVTIQLKSLSNQTITITDVLGRRIAQKKSDTTSYTFTAVFAKGMYFITIADPENKTSQVSKIIIQ